MCFSVDSSPLSYFLGRHGLSKYAATFHAQQITLGTIAELTVGDLKADLGVTVLGDRNRIMVIAKEAPTANEEWTRKMLEGGEDKGVLFEKRTQFEEKRKKD